MDEFNRKFFDINSQAAVTWAMNILDGFDLYHNELILVMTERFNKILANEFKNSNLQTRNCAIINSILKALDYLSAGQGQLILANLYMQNFCFAEAFQHYISIYSNLSCSKEMRETAGFEVACLIYNGLVIWLMVN